METINSRLKNWASILDEKTREQAITTSKMPFIFPHLALMPDAHLGKGATVGSVIPTLGAIIPAAVGVDIGCGMIAVKTQYKAADLPEDRKPLREEIERAIPLSAGKYNNKIVATAVPRIEELKELATKAGFEGNPIHINAPLQHMSKADIVREAHRLGLDTGLSWSCYDPTPDGKHCGLCDSCRLRAKGFDEAGLPDPTIYAVRP